MNRCLKTPLTRAATVRSQSGRPLPTVIRDTADGVQTERLLVNTKGAVWSNS